MPIQRTVIGSFPTQPISISHEEAIRKAIELQLDNGIHVVSDGEPYGDMKDYVTQNPGIELAYMGIKFTDRIWHADDPSKNLDPDKCWKIQDYKAARSYLDGKGRKDVKVKIALTGPISLVFFGKCGGLYESLGPYEKLSYEELYSDSVKVVGSIARRAVELGSYLQIDEPYLTEILPESVNDVLNSLFKSLTKSAIKEERVSIHVCRQLGKAYYDELVKLENVPILNIPFSGYQERKNLDVITRESLEENGKKLVAGIISNTEIEDVATVLKTLKDVSEKAGAENISFVSPICGFLKKPPEIVGPILKNMKEASELFIQSSKGQ